MPFDISSINSVKALKWIKIHGTKYVVDECYLAVKFDNEDQPQFSQLSGIFELNLHMVVFDVIFLETIGFDPLCSFQSSLSELANFNGIVIKFKPLNQVA